MCTKLEALWIKECRNEENKSEEIWKSKERWLMEIAQTNKMITKRTEQKSTRHSDNKQHQHSKNTQHSQDELKSISLESMNILNLKGNV